MTYNEKKSLYESIMKDVAKVVKRQLNESFQSSKITKFVQLSNELGKKFRANGGIGPSYKTYKVICIEPGKDIKKDGVYEQYTRVYSNFLSKVTDDECGEIMNSKSIINNDVFKPSNKKRYFIISEFEAHSFDDKQNSWHINYNPSKIAYAIELYPSAINSITTEMKRSQNKHSDSANDSESNEYKEKEKYFKKIIGGLLLKAEDYCDFSYSKNADEKKQQLRTLYVKIKNVIDSMFPDLSGSKQYFLIAKMIIAIMSVNDKFDKRYFDILEDFIDGRISLNDLNKYTN